MSLLARLCWKSHCWNPARASLALWLLLIFTGCIPSPNAPLGADQSADGSQRSETPTAESSKPPLRPLAPDESPDSEEFSTSQAGNDRSDDTRTIDRLLLPELPTPGRPPSMTADLSQSPSPPENSSRVSEAADADETRMPIDGDDPPRRSSNELYIPATASPAQPVVAIPESQSRKATPLASGDSTAGSGLSPPALPSHRPAPLLNPPQVLEMTVPLVGRRKFFGGPERTQPRVSPDGTLLAYLARREGVLSVYVAAIDDLEQSTPVTTTRRDIQEFSWAFTSRHILYVHDERGNGEQHVYSVSLDTEESRDLTPIDNISARVLAVSEQFPAEVIVGINDRPPHEWHDVHRINIVTGAHLMMLENPGFSTFHIDDSYAVRLAQSHRTDGGRQLFVADSNAPRGWRKFLAIDPVDALTTGFVSFDKTGNSAFVVDSRGRDTAALKKFDLATGTSVMIAESARADISGTMIHPSAKTVQAVTFNYDRRKWKVLDPEIEKDLQYLHSVDKGEISVTSRALDDSLWTVQYTGDRGPTKFYLYRRETQTTKFLFSSRSDLESLPLVDMHSVIIQSRDGLPLVSYLSLPRDADPAGDGKPSSPLPMVLYVHGGPWARDQWGYNPVHQLLANRGYAVLSVNFRGSSGFGKRFLNAGNREWAGKMHEDLLDAVQWAVTQGVAQPDRVAIMGGSYGGYAALVGLTFTPDVFACGIDIVGPNNLITLLENPPPHWLPFLPFLRDRVGDHETKLGREFLMSRSPLRFVDRISRPLLIAQGARDPSGIRSDADQIVEAMRKSGVPVTFMVYPEEGHGFQRPDNRFAFYAVAEAFLEKHLGGRSEPVGNDFDRALFDVPAGRELVPGLNEPHAP